MSEVPIGLTGQRLQFLTKTLDPGLNLIRELQVDFWGELPHSSLSPWRYSSDKTGLVHTFLLFTPSATGHLFRVGLSHFSFYRKKALLSRIPWCSLFLSSRLECHFFQRGIFFPWLPSCSQLTLTVTIVMSVKLDVSCYSVSAFCDPLIAFTKFCN